MDEYKSKTKKIGGLKSIHGAVSARYSRFNDLWKKCLSFQFEHISPGVKGLFIGS